MIRTIFFFFFQAEDGIRDPLVTGVQTCALPILSAPSNAARATTTSQAGGTEASIGPLAVGVAGLLAASALGSDSVAATSTVVAPPEPRPSPTTTTPTMPGCT